MDQRELVACKREIQDSLLSNSNVYGRVAARHLAECNDVQLARLAARKSVHWYEVWEWASKWLWK